MSAKEQLRMKVYSDRLVIGIMGRDTFNSYAKYELFGTRPDGYISADEPGKNVIIAREFGMILAKTFYDGGGDAHTQIFTRSGKL
jgi:hypothetical protein